MDVCVKCGTERVVNEGFSLNMRTKQPRGQRTCIACTTSGRKTSRAAQSHGSRKKRAVASEKPPELEEYKAFEVAQALQEEADADTHEETRTLLAEMEVPPQRPLADFLCRGVRTFKEAQRVDPARWEKLRRIVEKKKHQSQYLLQNIENAFTRSGRRDQGIFWCVKATKELGSRRHHLPGEGDVGMLNRMQRAFVADGIAVDVDIENAAPTVALYLARRLGVPAPQLHDLVHNRGIFYAEAFPGPGAKQEANAVLNGRGPQDFDTPRCRDLRAESRAINARLSKHLGEAAADIEPADLRRYIYEGIEAEFVRLMCDYLMRAEGIACWGTVFDGAHMSRYNARGDEWNHAVRIQEACVYAYEQTGVPLVARAKEWPWPKNPESGEPIPEEEFLESGLLLAEKPRPKTVNAIYEVLAGDCEKRLGEVPWVGIQENHGRDCRVVAADPVSHVWYHATNAVNEWVAYRRHLVGIDPWDHDFVLRFQRHVKERVRAEKRLRSQWDLQLNLECHELPIAGPPGSSALLFDMRTGDCRPLRIEHKVFSQDLADLGMPPREDYQRGLAYARSLLRDMAPTGGEVVDAWTQVEWMPRSVAHNADLPRLEGFGPTLAHERNEYEAHVRHIMGVLFSILGPLMPSVGLHIARALVHRQNTTRSLLALCGAGSNGKTLYLDLLKLYHGGERVGRMNLLRAKTDGTSPLEGNRDDVMRACGYFISYADETAQGKLDTGAYKDITGTVGGTELTCMAKFQGIINAIFKALPVLLMNDPVLNVDKDDKAFEKRLVGVSLPSCFPRDENHMKQIAAIRRDTVFFPRYGAEDWLLQHVKTNPMARWALRTCQYAIYEHWAHLREPLDPPENYNETAAMLGLNDTQEGDAADEWMRVFWQVFERDPDADRWWTPQDIGRKVTISAHVKDDAKRLGTSGDWAKQIRPRLKNMFPRRGTVLNGTPPWYDSPENIRKTGAHYPTNAIGFQGLKLREVENDVPNVGFVDTGYGSVGFV